MSESLSESPGAAPTDVDAVITALWVYPVKSCAGVQVTEAILTETGLEFDRAWMVVDKQGEFVTQRELPRMALIRPQLKTQDMVLRAPGMLALHIALDQVQEPVRVKVWDDEVKAYDMGPVAAQWFSDFLGAKLRLVRFDPEEKRLSSPRWTGSVEALNQFSDGYPLLVISEASLAGLNDKLLAEGSAPVTMERFRPNIVLGNASGDTAQALVAHDEDRLNELQVGTEQGLARLKPVKPCARCPIPNIDPATALSSPEVNDMLQTYRQDPQLGGALTFGMNLIRLDSEDHLLRVGQAVTANYRFD
ncbi:MOSC domain-containing protein [Polaromonas sp.]|uniref:MOSC domain-containing protein n=1 Tax=Polaromonas sp. TaxID=1869339 RepID=UPI00356521C1